MPVSAIETGIGGARSGALSRAAAICSVMTHSVAIGASRNRPASSWIAVEKSLKAAQPPARASETKAGAVAEAQWLPQNYASALAGAAPQERCHEAVRSVRARR